MSSVHDTATLSPAPGQKFAPKPNTSDYGYQGKYDDLYPCTRAELIAKVGRLNWFSPSVKRVWTPEIGTLVEPHEISYLFAPFKQRLRKVAFLKIFISTALLGGSAWLMQRFPLGILFLPLLFVIVPTFLYLVDGVQTLLRLKNLQPETMAQPVGPQLQPEEIARIVHLQTLRLTWTKEIMACLITVGVLQLFAAGSGILAAGLVKPLVRQGEIWRLLTAGMLHGGLFHFWMNFASLTWLGRMTEAFTHRVYLPIVFVLAILGGTLCSLLLTPAGVSVGASGGLLGLVGFLVVVGWRHKTLVPANFFQNLLINLAMIAVVGFIGRNFIDNAGHLGGLLTGFMLGFGLVPAQVPTGHFIPSASLLKVGQIFRFLIPVLAVATCLLMFRWDLPRGVVLLIVVGTIAFLAVRKLALFDRY